MRCRQQAAGQSFAFDRRRFETFAAENFGSPGATENYLRRMRGTSRGPAQELAMVVAEARLAEAISAPPGVTYRVHAVRHDNLIIIVGDELGTGGFPQAASSPSVIQSRQLSTLDELSDAVSWTVREANALLPFHRRIAGVRPRRGGTCSPARRRRRGCSGVTD
jgi:hypothetical protein